MTNDLTNARDRAARTMRRLVTTDEEANQLINWATDFVSESIDDNYHEYATTGELLDDLEKTDEGYQHCSPLEIAALTFYLTESLDYLRLLDDDGPLELPANRDEFITYLSDDHTLERLRREQSLYTADYLRFSTEGLTDDRRDYLDAAIQLASDLLTLTESNVPDDLARLFDLIADDSYACDGYCPTLATLHSTLTKEH